MAVIAIDTGGTKIAGALVDASGRIGKKVQFPNTGRTGGFIMDTYRKILKELGAEETCQAIGIGAGGRIEEKTGRVLYAVDIYRDYIGLDIRGILEEEFQKPVFVTNDCRAALLGEAWMGAARGYQKIAALILGTGVGGGFLYQGKLLDGDKGGLGEFGHMILRPGGRVCACGQKGCAEQYLSGTSLWQIYNERMTGAHGFAPIQSGYEFFQRLDGGDSEAEKVLEDFTENLAMCLVSLANAFDPDAILLGGGLVDTKQVWWKSMEEKFLEMGNIHVKKVPVLAAENGNRAALLGAARFAYDGLEDRLRSS